MISAVNRLAVSQGCKLSPMTLTMTTYPFLPVLLHLPPVTLTFTFVCVILFINLRTYTSLPLVKFMVLLNAAGLLMNN